MVDGIYNYVVDCLHNLNIYDGDIVNLSDSNRNDILSERGFDNILKFKNNNTKLSFKDSSVDIIICLGVLENLNRKKSGILAMEIKRVCQQDGCIVIIVPKKKEKDNIQYLSSDDILDHFFPLDIAFDGSFNDNLILMFINEK